MSSTSPPRPPRGRWAPSPTGWLHLGNARTALVAWLSVRSRGGTFVWRLEDLDPPRTVAGAAQAAMDDLAWLGLDWDEGPDVGGPHAPYVQSERYDLYEAALERLVAAGRLFPCDRSRREIREATQELQQERGNGQREGPGPGSTDGDEAEDGGGEEAVSSAPHGRPSRPPYPKALRPQDLQPGWYERRRRREPIPEDGPRPPGSALRFLVREEPVVFDDLLFGSLTERVDRTVGDFVVRRRDGLWAYQLAVVVDDLEMEIDEVVRGADLLSSTGRQIQLIEALGGERPRWGHVPLVLNAQGEKLSKRDEGLNLRSLRVAGALPEELVGWMGWSLGLMDEPEPLTARDLIPRFAWERLPKEDWVLPEDFEQTLGSDL